MASIDSEALSWYCDNKKRFRYLKYFIHLMIPKMRKDDSYQK